MGSSSKVRVYELARDLGLDDSKPLIRILKDMGYDVKTASSGLPDDAVNKVREIVAPHIEQLRREAEAAQKAREEAERKAAEAVAARPQRTIRIARRATDEEKKALLDRHERKLRGEEVEEPAVEVLRAAAELAAPAPAEPMAASPAAVAEPQARAGGAEEAPAHPSGEGPGDDEGADKELADLPDIRPEEFGVAEEEEGAAAPQAGQGVGRPPEEVPIPPSQAFAAIHAPKVDKGALADRTPGRGPRTREIKDLVPPRGPGSRTPTRTGSPGLPARPGMRQGPGAQKRLGGGRSKSRGRDRGPISNAPVSKDVEIPEMISLSELASRLELPASELIKHLIRQGRMVTINQALNYDEASDIARSYGFNVGAMADENIDLALIEDEDEGTLEARPPVVTVLGHVDHGKTSLLDAIRKTQVTAGEAGGITQKIGAYTVHHNERLITFVDTPGHEAFTQMRARGAQITDIAILVVAADDGVMPQTIEAINHAKAAKVPILVAVNKIDLAGANPDKVMQQLTEHGLVAEAWGGDTIMVPVSAKAGTGLTDLLEMILLVADLKEFKANPHRHAQGTIVEAWLDKGMGPVATVLVQAGTLRPGDTVVVGSTWGRVRGLINEHGERIRRAGPSIPAEIIGLSDVPRAGDHLQVVEDEKMARQVSEARTARQRHQKITAGSKQTLEGLFAEMKVGQAAELNLLLKADGHGSVEALNQSLNKLSTGEVRVNVVHSAVGAISESDVMLASASGAIIIGYNVRPDAVVKRLADQEQVDIRLYRVIYHVIEDIRKAMSGLLTPDIEEVEVGRVEVRQVFKITRVGKVAGCYVLEGKVHRGALARLVRDGVVVYEGAVETLRRFKEDVKEVLEGYECGLTLENYQDLQEKDILEIYRREERERELQ